MRRDRKLNRLREYDYSSAGYYFVTVCVKDRIERFGEVKDGRVMFNENLTCQALLKGTG